MQFAIRYQQIVQVIWQARDGEPAFRASDPEPVKNLVYSEGPPVYNHCLSGLGTQSRLTP